MNFYEKTDFARFIETYSHEHEKLIKSILTISTISHQSPNVITIGIGFMPHQQHFKLITEYNYKNYVNYDISPDNETIILNSFKKHIEEICLLILSSYSCFYYAYHVDPLY